MEATANKFHIFIQLILMTLPDLLHPPIHSFTHFTRSKHALYILLAIVHFCTFCSNINQKIISSCCECKKRGVREANIERREIINLHSAACSCLHFTSVHMWSKKKWLQCTLDIAFINLLLLDSSLINSKRWFMLLKLLT